MLAANLRSNVVIFGICVILHVCYISRMQDPMLCYLLGVKINVKCQRITKKRLGKHSQRATIEDMMGEWHCSLLGNSQRTN
jgi:hypothetical protein